MTSELDLTIISGLPHIEAPERTALVVAMTQDGKTGWLTPAQILALALAGDPQALKDFSNVDPEVARAALELGALATKSNAAGVPYDKTASDIDADETQTAIDILAKGLRLRGPVIEIPLSGTYTPDAVVEKILVIGQGAGGGVPAVTARGISAGGGAGGRAKKFIDATELTIIIGAGVSGDDGGNTTVTGTGISLEANGGAVAEWRSAGSSFRAAPGGEGGSATGGDTNVVGQPGKASFMTNSSDDVAIAGEGGSTIYGSAGRAGAENASSFLSEPSSGFGAGASGNFLRSGSQPAVAGQPGVTYILEFVRAS